MPDGPADVVALSEALARRELTSVALVEQALARYTETEPHIQAFTWLDRERALRLARLSDERRASGQPVGRLEGIPIAVKDIFDTAGIPTENGSRLFAGRVPERRAAALVVDGMLGEAGRALAPENPPPPRTPRGGVAALRGLPAGAVRWAAANWLLQAAALWCFVASLGHYVDPAVLFAAFGIANVAADYASLHLLPGSTARARGRAGQWQNAPEYLLRSLPGHAHNGGVGEEMLPGAPHRRGLPPRPPPGCGNGLAPPKSATSPARQLFLP